MKTIGLITSPLSTGHSPRGIGVYTQNLLTHLQTLAPKSDLNIVELSSPEIPADSSVDLIHYPFFDLFYSTLPFSRQRPTFVTIHDVAPLIYPRHYPPGIRGSIALFRQRLALKTVTRVITDSYASVTDLHRFLHLPHSKIKLIYLAAPDSFIPISDRSELHRISQKYHLPSKFILYVGDINYNKNLPLLIKTALKLGYPLVIVGKNPAQIDQLDLRHPELAHLQTIIPDLTSPLVIRLGFIPEPDVIVLYSLATVYCQPSLYEGFGFPVLEAMTCGCPVVCSSAGSLPEVAGSAAIYFDPHNQHDLEQAITSVYNHPPQRQKLIKAGKIQAAKFSWTKTATETIIAYQEVL